MLGARVRDLPEDVVGRLWTVPLFILYSLRQKQNPFPSPNPQRARRTRPQWYHMVPRVPWYDYNVEHPMAGLFAKGASIYCQKFMIDITTPAKLQTHHVGAGGRRHGAPLPGLGGEPDATRSRAYPHLHPLRVPISLLRGRLLPRANRNGRRACWVFYALPGSKFLYPIGVSSRAPSVCLHVAVVVQHEL